MTGNASRGHTGASEEVWKVSADSRPKACQEREAMSHPSIKSSISLHGMSLHSNKAPPSLSIKHINNYFDFSIKNHLVGYFKMLTSSMIAGS